LGTPADNVADMDSKRRRGIHFSRTKPEFCPRGEQHGRSKVTEAQVRAIRGRYAQGNISLSALGREYGVGHTSIKRIVDGTYWGHIV
jgi:hypothetical protein